MLKHYEKKGKERTSGDNKHGNKQRFKITIVQLILNRNTNYYNQSLRRRMDYNSNSTHSIWGQTPQKFQKLNITKLTVTI